MQWTAQWTQIHNVFSRVLFKKALMQLHSVGNLVPRSHFVTENVRSGKVRQYTLFHWLLKKRLRQCNLRSDLLISWGTSVKVKWRSSFRKVHVLFWINASCAEESIVFSRRRKSFTVEENDLKNLRRLCKWYRRKPHVPCHSNKFLRSWLRGTQKLINSSWSI